MCAYIHTNKHVCMFTHIQFALTCHPCARSPQYLARCKGTVNTVE